MSAKIQVMEPAGDGPRVWRGGAWGPPVSRLSIIHEMLESLDTLTIAGRRHVMSKVFKLVEGPALQAAARSGERNRATLLDLTLKLRQESGRMVPDPQLFAGAAERLLGLLGPPA